MSDFRSVSLNNSVSQFNSTFIQKIELVHTINRQLYSRAKEVYNILQIIVDSGMNLEFSLYLVFVHHELYVKSKLPPYKVLEIISNINDYGHNIDSLITEIEELHETEIINRHIDLAINKNIIPNIKYYPDLRYNFNRRDLKVLHDRNVADILKFNVSENPNLIRNLIDDILQGFNYE